MTLRVIDVETTGIDPATSGVVEVASIDIVKDGSFWRPIERRVDPGMTIPPEASAVHHIIDADVRGCLKLVDVIGDFTKKTDASEVIFIAHSADFERAFLDELLGRPKWICTRKVAHRIWPDAPGYSNQTLHYWRGLVTPFDIDRKSITPHGAMSDVIVTGALLFDIVKNKLASFDDMLRWSNEPILYQKFGFGKHKGVPLAEVARTSPDYLEWVIAKSELDADAKFSARHWLDIRGK